MASMNVNSVICKGRMFLTKHIKIYFEALFDQVNKSVVNSYVVTRCWREEGFVTENANIPHKLFLPLSESLLLSFIS
ncbi:hypothetical protein KAX03_02665 [Candidatus Bathyarchaeota archaeon]|nr:hypothetical protein [Candidatus Bathyarchaeota archaeon]